MVELSPQTPYIYNNRGLVYKDLRQFDNAMADFSKAIELQPDNSIYANRGDIYIAINEYEKAVEEYSIAISKDSKNWVYYYTRGNGYTRLNKKAEAIADYETALSLTNDAAWKGQINLILMKMKQN